MSDKVDKVLCDLCCYHTLNKPCKNHKGCISKYTAKKELCEVILDHIRFPKDMAEIKKLFSQK